MTTKKELDEIDTFVANQLALKNRRMRQATNGIFIVDRAPLDLFAFESDKAKWPRKAKRVLQSIKRGKAQNRELADCHVILLNGDPDVLEVRAKANHRDTDRDKLAAQQETLNRIYDRGDGTVSVVDTRNKTPGEVANEISRIVHLKEYIPTPLQAWLEEYADA